MLSIPPGVLNIVVVILVVAVAGLSLFVFGIHKRQNLYGEAFSAVISRILGKQSEIVKVLQEIVPEPTISEPKPAPRNVGSKVVRVQEVDPIIEDEPKDESGNFDSSVYEAAIQESHTNSDSSETQL